jgi:hypothetical protein
MFGRVTFVWSSVGFAQVVHFGSLRFTSVVCFGSESESHTLTQYTCLRAGPQGLPEGGAVGLGIFVHAGERGLRKGEAGGFDGGRPGEFARW